MPRVFRVRNFDVYVPSERGERHHLPHAHIRRRGQLVATVFLVTLTVQHAIEALPSDLIAELRARQDELLDRWKELNDDPD